jgi:Fe-S-cluster-containing dehydrogenase component
MEHELTMGPRPIRVMQVGAKEVKGKPRTLYIPMPCYQCDPAACIPACPTGAMHRRDKDGIVLVDSEACIGCKQCMQACPFAAPQYDTRNGKIIKCDFCMARANKGYWSACTTKCSIDAMKFGYLKDLKDFIEELGKERDIQRVGSVYYAFPKEGYDIPRRKQKLSDLHPRSEKVTPPEGKPYRP